MGEDKRLESVKKRADSTVFRDVHFTPAMEEKVRRRLSRRAGTLAGWRRLSLGVASLLVLAVVWQMWPVNRAFDRERAAILPSPAPELLPEGSLEVPVLWKPSPRTETVFAGKPFSYIGKKPVRIVSDGQAFFEGQQQRVIWLVDDIQAAEVELVAYSAKGQRLQLGSYQVGGPLFDAHGHFPSGIVLPEPGIWKLQALAGGAHLGQVFVEVKAGVSVANRELVEPLIREYIEAAGAKLGWLGDGREVSIDLLGVEAPDAARRKVYAWVKILSSNPALSSGISAPMAFTIAYDGNEYKVTGFQMPEDGSGYQSSLQKLFPTKVLEQIRSRQP